MRFDGSLNFLAKQLRSSLLPAQTNVLPLQANWQNAAVFVLLYRTEADQLHTVLTRRSKELPSHAGEISLPGGRQEQGESDLRLTALREVQEEIGLCSQALEIVGALPVLPTAISQHMVYPFVAITHKPQTWRYDRKEVAHLLEPTLGDLLAGSGTEQLKRRGFRVKTSVYRLGDDVVWGATARIFQDFFARTQGLFKDSSI